MRVHIYACVYFGVPLAEQRARFLDCPRIAELRRVYEVPELIEGLLNKLNHQLQHHSQRTPSVPYGW